MAFGSRESSYGFLFLICSLQVMILISIVKSDASDAVHLMISKTPATQSDAKDDHRLDDCQNCSDEKNIDITATYTDTSGVLRTYTVKSKDLSASWSWGNLVEEHHGQLKGGLGQEGSFQQVVSGLHDDNQTSTSQEQQANPISPAKLKRMQRRKKRREDRHAQLIQLSEDSEMRMRTEAIERSKQFNIEIRGKYSIWRRDSDKPPLDSTLKVMKDQIIMAKIYACIARSKKQLDLYDSLMNCIKEGKHAIGEAISDAELKQSALEGAKAMGHVLSVAKDKLYDCAVVARKLQAMLYSKEEDVNALKKQGLFLIQQAVKTISKSLHCLPLQLTTDYFLRDHTRKEIPDKNKLEDPSLYHYAIFSDNILSTSVVVNSTVIHAKEPEKHVFHIVTDGFNFAAMKMWFIAHPPLHANIHVENIDEFKWLNSSYCSVLRQLESASMKKYYFEVNHPSSTTAANENLNFRNPKYLSMLNHLRFYMPEIFPNLDKILFLDDDVVVQKDLAPLWSIDMKGMVNGAVETCREGFHQFHKYLNFSNPKISKDFDPYACGWAFGMNIFDLKEWKKRDITRTYHYWQDMNEDRQLWQLGSLPAGLLAFYNLTYALDRSWHVLGLGYNRDLNVTEIEAAAVIHYNGNYKPWLDLALVKYKPYWSKFVNIDSPYFQLCNINL